MGSTLSGMMTQVVEEKPVHSPGTQAYLDRMSQNYCLRRLRIHRQGRYPVKCPYAAPMAIDSSRSTSQSSKRRPRQRVDSKPMSPMRRYSDAMDEGCQRPFAPCRLDSSVVGQRPKIEKSARKLGMTTITLEYAAPMIQEAAAEDYTRFSPTKGPTAPGAGSRGNQRNQCPYAQRQWNIGSPKRLLLPTPGRLMLRGRLDRAPEGFMRGMHQGLDRKTRR